MTAAFMLAASRAPKAAPGWAIWLGAALACLLIADGLRRLMRRQGR